MNRVGLRVSEREPDDVLFAGQDASVSQPLQERGRHLARSAPRHVSVISLGSEEIDESPHRLFFDGRDVPVIHGIRRFEAKNPAEILWLRERISESKPVKAGPALVQNELFKAVGSFPGSGLEDWKGTRNFP